MWWGTLGLMAIEGTVFALTVMAYFYLRSHASLADDALPPDLLWGTLNTAIMLASLVPNHWPSAPPSARPARRALWLVHLPAVRCAFLVVRGFEFAGAQRALGQQRLRLRGLDAAGPAHHAPDHRLLRHAVLAVLIFTGPLEGKRYVDVSENAPTGTSWCGAWLPIYLHRGVSGWQAAAFAGGQLALVAALVSPLDALGTLLFSAHMVQHEILMVVAAPLLVIGRPLAVWTWGLPPRWRSGAGNAARLGPIAATWRVLTHPAVAWALHGVVLWAWHMPWLFEAALARPGVHTLQHTSFFASALLFWWAPLGSASRQGQGASMFYLFTTMVHTAALGALLTLSPALWYPAYASTSPAFGLDPLEDQQLGGLVMWVPAGLAYLAVGLALAARWLRDGGTARGAALKMQAPGSGMK
jgi:putative membrane protein